jgi:hypothetical protein
LDLKINKFGSYEEVGRMGEQHPHLLKLAPTRGRVKSSIPHGAWRFFFFQILFLLKLEYTWTFILGFLFHEKVKSQKIPQELLMLWKCFVPFFNARCI